MKRHLTERELIEYQFKLVSDFQMQELTEHLDGCSDCRERFERLERKFSALDLLREEVVASEDLISRTVEQTSTPRREVQTRVIPFRGPVWTGAVAAVLLMGALLLVSHLGKDRIVEGPEVVTAPRPAEPPAKLPLAAKTEMGRTVALDATDGVRRTTSLNAWKYGAELGDKLSTFAEAATAKGVMPEQPPFAPASAIELVVLPRREKVQLTIYNSADLTLVRERRNLTLKRGWNWLQFMWANTLIDPTSLSLEPLAQAEKIDIQQLVFPARLRELGRWLIRSEVGGQVPFEITYFTSGLNWRAFYMGTLAQDERTMCLDGYVRVGNNSGEDYENAQTRLIVGKVHILDRIAELAKRQYPYNRPGGPPVTEEGKAHIRDLSGDAIAFADKLGVIQLDAAFLKLRPKEIKKEGLSEYFLYTIEGTETIADKWGKRLLSFEADDIKVKSLYKYDEERWQQQTIRFVSFSNDEEHNLGETPIPNGQVKIYGQADERGYLSYVGGTDVKYIPVDEEVELNLGPARLVRVEPVLMDIKTDNYVFDKKGNIAGWDEIRTWKTEVINTRPLPIEIEITRGFGTAYWTLQADIPYEKHDATHARFKVTRKPRSKWSFGYTARTYHGVREQGVTERENE